MPSESKEFVRIFLSAPQKIMGLVFSDYSVCYLTIAAFRSQRVEKNTNFKSKVYPEEEFNDLFGESGINLRMLAIPFVKLLTSCYR